MSAYDGILPPSPLDRAVDAAIAEVNAEYLSDPAARAEAARVGQMWRAIADAERAAGQHAVVLPIALAEEIQDYLMGSTSAVWTPDLLARMLADHLRRAGRR